MKQITMMSGRTFIISEEEAKNIKKILTANLKKLIELRSGDLLNPASIESIGEPEKKPYYNGNLMSKDLTKVFVNGEWKMFAGSKEDIEFKTQIKETTNINKLN